jgi:hypothetical protein
MENPVRFGPVRSRDAVVGEFGGDELVGYASDPERHIIAQAAAERGDDLGQAVCEKLLDGGCKRPGESECRVDGGGVAPGFDRGDELAADAGAGGEFALCEAAFESALA